MTVQPESYFETFSPAQWSQHYNQTPPVLNEDELASLRGYNESISLAEVTAVYAPICQLLILHAQAIQQLHERTRAFIDSKVTKVPFIIGISGSVAVGKSTTSRIIHLLLSRIYQQDVELITTDGFLWPNNILRQRNLMTRKGFPESYRLHDMLNFLAGLKSGHSPHAIPYYSHESYDIVPDTFQTVGLPDIVIIEGLNLLNINQHNHHRITGKFVSDFLDFTLYVHAETALIKSWYVERFMSFRAMAVDKPEQFFHQFTRLSDNDAIAYAKRVWNETNARNLEENIYPFHRRADLILQKGNNHEIQWIKLKRI